VNFIVLTSADFVSLSIVLISSNRESKLNMVRNKRIAIHRYTDFFYQI
jgi:hypothetical protein